MNKLRFSIVWIVGLLSYLVLILPNGYKGTLSLLEYFIFGAIITCVGLGIAAVLSPLVLSQLLRVRSSWRYLLLALTASIGILVVVYGMHQTISGRGENRSIVIGWFVVVLSLLEVTLVRIDSNSQSDERANKSSLVRLAFGAAALVAAFSIIFWHARQTSEELLIPSLWEGWIVEPWFYPASLAIALGFCFGALALRAMAHRSYRSAACYGLIVIIVVACILFQPSIYSFVCYSVPIWWIALTETATIGALAAIFLRDAYRISVVATHVREK
jgi:hypothetical protein